MSTAEQLLTAARAAGLVIVAEGDRLRFHPRDRMTVGLADRLREHKAAILTALAAESAGSGADLDAEPLPEWADPALWVETPDGALVRIDCEPATQWDEAAGDGGEPCAKCGSLEWWTDGLNRQRCGRCEREALDRALRLRARAAQKRRRANGWFIQHSVLQPNR